MSNTVSSGPYARRWAALLAENAIVQSEHLELSSFTLPYSAKQIAQVEASAARHRRLSLELHDLVGEWTADARRALSMP